MTYHPQVFRYSGQGQLINDDFCMTLTQEKPGAAVSHIILKHQLEALECQMAKSGTKLQGLSIK